MTPLGREVLAARAMLEVALAYRDRAPPPDPGEVALRLETLGEQVREVIGTLRNKGLLVEVTAGGLVPARPLELLTLADVRRAISGEPLPGLAAGSPGGGDPGRGGGGRSGGARPVVLRGAVRPRPHGGWSPRRLPGTPEWGRRVLRLPHAFGTLADFALLR